MSLDTLKVFTFDLIAFGCTSAIIKSCWYAIQNRHKEFDYTPPIMVLDSILDVNVT